MSDLSINTAQYALTGSAIGVGGIGGLQTPQQDSGPSQPVGAAGGSAQATGPAAAAQISKQGQLFSQLQQLQTSDPDKLKQLLTDAADKLSTAAQSASGADQQFLSSLAAKFTRAASGDLSALEPPQRAASSAVGAAYQQGAQTTLDGASLTTLAQNAASGANGPAGPAQPGATGSSGGHHHHHHGGGHSKLSASTQQTLQSVFQGLSSALGGSSASDSAATTATTASLTA